VINGKLSEGMKSPSSTNEFPMLPSLEALTAACGEKILNPDFLLHGGGIPFTEPASDDLDEKTNGINGKDVKSPKMEEKVLSPIQKDLASPLSIASPQLASPSNDDTKSEIVKSEEDQSNDTNNNGKAETFDSDFDGEHSPKRPIITLKSRKMKGLKDLLLAEKLNTNAISLQITAQSHIGNKKSRSSILGDESTDGSRPKRSRRE
jgi:menin